MTNEQLTLQRQELTGVGLLLEHDGVPGLDAAELVRHDDRGHHIIAQRRGTPRDDTQRLVFDIVQEHVSGHPIL